MASGDGSEAPENFDTGEISDWRSIVTLVVFIITSECKTDEMSRLYIYETG